MNSIRYMQAHNPQPTPPNDSENRRLCWQARHAETAEERLAARNELVLRNQGLIVIQAKIVHKATRFPLDDLVSEGQIALMRAIELFRPEEGFAFSTYASHCIRRHLGRQSWVHGGEIVLPCHLHVSAKKRRGPLHKEAERARRLRSLSTPTSHKRVLADELLDRDPGPTEADEAANQAMLGRLMNLLTGREREVVVCRYGLEDRDRSTLGEASEIFGVTRERVRQLEHQAIGKMAETMRKEMSA